MALNAKHRWSTATSTIKERRVVTKEVAKRYQRVRKKEKGKTPYQRMLESPHISKDSKEKLRKQYTQLNPAELKREITRQQNRLWKQVKENRWRIWDWTF